MSKSVCVHLSSSGAVQLWYHLQQWQHKSKASWLPNWPDWKWWQSISIWLPKSKVTAKLHSPIWRWPSLSDWFSGKSTVRITCGLPSSCFAGHLFIFHPQRWSLAVLLPLSMLIFPSSVTAVVCLHEGAQEKANLRTNRPAARPATSPPNSKVAPTAANRALNVHWADDALANALSQRDKLSQLQHESGSCNISQRSVPMTMAWD